ncbi:MAG: hypothetical protein WKF87_09880 [Chryseolinea sp.]
MKIKEIFTGKNDIISAKTKVGKLLLSLGITLSDDLPPLEDESTITRSPREIAERILILSGRGGMSFRKNFALLRKIGDVVGFLF